MKFSYLKDSDPLVYSLAILHNLINLIEFIIADCECEDVKIHADVDVVNESYFVPHKICVEPKNCTYECSNYSEEASILNKYFKCNIMLKEFNNECMFTLNYEKLINVSKELIHKLTISYLRHYVLKTKLTKVEYMMLVNRFGKLLIIEGSEDKVSLPLSFKTLRNIVISSHTHPYNCIPSHRDLEQLELIMSYGGLGGAILGPSCITLIYRNKPLMYDDLIRLREIKKKIKEGNFKDFIKMIKDLKSVSVILFKIS